MSGVQHLENLANAIENKKYAAIIKGFESLLKYQTDQNQDLKVLFKDAEKSSSKAENENVIGKAIKCVYSTKSRQNMVETLLTGVAEMVDNDEDLLPLLAREELMATLFKICIDKDYLLRVRRSSAYLILGFTSSSTKLCKQVAKLIETSKELQLEVQQLGMTFFSLTHYPIQEMLSEFLYRLSRVWKKTPSRHVKKMLSYFPDSFFDCLRSLKGSEFESGLRELLNTMNTDVNESLFSFALKEIFQVIDWEETGSENSLGDVEWLDIGSECISVYIKPLSEETSLICIPYSSLEKVEFLERALSIKMDISSDIENLELLTQRPPDNDFTRLRLFIKGTKKDFISVRDTILKFLPNEKDQDDASQATTDSESKVSGATMKDKKKVASEIKILQEEFSQSSIDSQDQEEISVATRSTANKAREQKLKENSKHQEVIPHHQMEKSKSNNQHSTPEAAIVILDEEDSLGDLGLNFQKTQELAAKNPPFSVKVKKEKLDDNDKENVAPNLKSGGQGQKKGFRKKGLQATNSLSSNKTNANLGQVSAKSNDNPVKKRILSSTSSEEVTTVKNTKKIKTKQNVDYDAFELSDDEEKTHQLRTSAHRKRKQNPKGNDPLGDLSFGAEQNSPSVMKKAFQSKPEPKQEIPSKRRRQKSFPHKIYNKKDKLLNSPGSPTTPEDKQNEDEIDDISFDTSSQESAKEKTAVQVSKGQEASQMQKNVLSKTKAKQNSTEPTNPSLKLSTDKNSKGTPNPEVPPKETSSQNSDLTEEEAKNDDQDSDWDKEDDISIDDSQESVDLDDLSQSPQKPRKRHSLPASLENEGDDLGILMKELLNMTRERELKSKKRKAEALIDQGKAQVAQFLVQWSKRSCTTWDTELVKVTAYVEKITEEAEAAIKFMSEEYEKHVECQQEILARVTEKANDFQKINEKVEMTVKSWKQNNQLTDAKLQKAKEQSLSSFRKDVAAFHQRALSEKSSGDANQSILSLLK